MYGINNELINYMRVCLLNAVMIKKHLGSDIKVGIVGNDWDFASLTPQELVIFNEVVDDKLLLPQQFTRLTTDRSMSQRVYRNTAYYETCGTFNNQTRFSAYELSPYDETILLDCDYLVQSDVLNKCWGSCHDVLINKQAHRPNGTILKGPEWRLSPHGIRMFWATCVYFKKTPLAQHIFSLVEHVRDNWSFYRIVYGIQNTLFRNDYAFSIAIHKLNGLVDQPPEISLVQNLPNPSLMSVLDRDRVEWVAGVGMIAMLVDFDQPWVFHPINVNGHDIHIMNKMGLLEQLPKIMQHYGYDT